MKGHLFKREDIIVIYSIYAVYKILREAVIFFFFFEQSKKSVKIVPPVITYNSVNFTKAQN